MKWLAILAVLLGSVARCQSLELQGGASNLLDADGASAIYSSGQWATEADVGIAQSRLVYGLGVHFQFHGCDWFAGDHQENYSTTVAGLSASSRGLAVECKSKYQTIRVFTGATGDLHSTPYFTATVARHFGNGFEYVRTFGDVEFTGVAAFAGGNRVLLEGVKYHYKDFKFDESAGTALGKRYFEGEALFQSRNLSASVIHADYFGIATLNSEQVTAGNQNLSVFASAFQSRTSGEAFGVNASLGRIRASVTRLSEGGTRQTDVFVTERISQRFSTNQFISGRNVSFGGSMTSNLLTASVGYQEMFTPTMGFQRAMNVSLRIQLSRGTVNTSVSVLPSGVFYTGYAGIYATGPSLAGGGDDHAAP